MVADKSPSTASAATVPQLPLRASPSEPHGSSEYGAGEPYCSRVYCTLPLYSSGPAAPSTPAAAAALAFASSGAVRLPASDRPAGEATSDPTTRNSTGGDAEEDDEDDDVVLPELVEPDTDASAARASQDVVPQLPSRPSSQYVSPSLQGLTTVTCRAAAARGCLAKRSNTTKRTCCVEPTAAGAREGERCGW